MHRVFSTPSLKRQGSPNGVTGWRESEIFLGEIFLLGGKNLRRSGFDHLNLFSKLKPTLFKY